MRFKFSKRALARATKLEAGCNVTAGIPDAGTDHKQSRAGIRLMRQGEVTMTNADLLKLLKNVYAQGLREGDAAQALVTPQSFEDNVVIQRIVKRLGLDKA